MTSGKAAAQAGHAFLASFLKSDSDAAAAYLADEGGVKVVLAAPDESTLWQVYRRASDAGIPCCIWTEREPDGVPYVTAVGIGPADRTRTKAIVSSLKLYGAAPRGDLSAGKPAGATILPQLNG